MASKKNSNPIKYSWEYDLYTLPGAEYRAGLIGLLAFAREQENFPIKISKIEGQEDHRVQVSFSSVDLMLIFSALYKISPLSSLLSEEMIDLSDRSEIKKEHCEIDLQNRLGSFNFANRYYQIFRESEEKRLFQLYHRTFVQTLNPSRRAINFGFTSSNYKKTFLAKKRFETAKKEEESVLKANEKFIAELAEEFVKKHSELGSYFVGTLQNKSDDNVVTKQDPRLTFLLHFWPLVSHPYEVSVKEIKDGKWKKNDNKSGLVWVIPDVMNLNYADLHFKLIENRLIEIKNQNSKGPNQKLVVRLAKEALLDSCVFFYLLNQKNLKKSIRSLAGYDVHFFCKPEKAKKYDFQKFESWKMNFEDQETIEKINKFQILQFANIFHNDLFSRFLENILNNNRLEFNLEGFLTRAHPNEISFSSFNFFKHLKQIGTNQEMKDRELILNFITAIVFNRTKQRYPQFDSDKKSPENYAKMSETAKDLYITLRQKNTQSAVIETVTTQFCSYSSAFSKESFLRLSELLDSDWKTLKAIMLLALAKFGVNNEK